MKDYILKFATKRNVNGNRKYIAIDFRYHAFSRNPQHWFCREDFVEVTTKDLHKLVDFCIERHFTEVDAL